MEKQEKTASAQNKEKKSFKEVMKVIWMWTYRLRSVILSIPVAIGAILLAIYNRDHLPETVGINIQSSGVFAQTVEKNVAVMGPLAVTAVCLLLMFISRRVVYPWLISLFSLTLPLLILITNTFPY